MPVFTNIYLYGFYSFTDKLEDWNTWIKHVKTLLPLDMMANVVPSLTDGVNRRVLHSSEHVVHVTHDLHDVDPIMVATHAASWFFVQSSAVKRQTKFKWDVLQD